MLSVTIYVNDQPIYTRTAVNVGLGKDDEHHVYEVDTGERVHHKQEDGAVALAKLLLDTIHEST